MPAAPLRPRSRQGACRRSGPGRGLGLGGGLLLALAACSSPSPHFMGMEATRIMVEGLRIDVYADREVAQAIRMSRAWPFAPADMARHGIVAIEAATGCPVRRSGLRADESVLTARLACPD